MTLRNICLILAAIPAFGMDAAVYNLAMPDAKVLVGFDAGRAATSPLAQSLMSRLSLDTGEFQKFIDATGFDPRKDLAEVLVSNIGEPGGKHSVVIAKGRFDRGRIEALIGVHGGAVESYGGIRVLGKDGGGIAFLSDTLAVAGSTDEVKGAIDRYRASAKLSPAIAAQVQSASSKYDAWLVSTVSPSSLAPGAGTNTSTPMRAELFQSIESFQGGLRFLEDQVEFVAEALARTEKDATALVDVFKFLTQMAAGNLPPDSPMTRMIQTLDASTSGRTANIRMAASSGVLEAFFASHSPVRARVQRKQVQ